LQPVLKLIQITKSFPGVKALKEVSLDVMPGEVHALMGENGAGKSTLMKIVAGMIRPDVGTIELDGQAVQIRNEREAMAAGISMIHQELMPVKQMTIAENIFLGREPGIGLFGIVNKREMHKNTSDLLKRVGVDLSPKLMMKQLSVAETQLVEISKAISYNSRIIIMDEPTSAITDREVEKLFGLIRALKEQGVAIIYISHKMDEIFQISDRITILRDGQYVGSAAAKELDNEKLIKMMVGRGLSNIFPKTDNEAGEVCLEVRGLTRTGEFRNISFQVRKGEIVGIAGLMGAGRTELAETIFGLRKADSGEILIHGRKVSIHTPQDAIRNGIALVPEDRKGVGLNLIASVKDNLTLPNLGSFQTAGIIGFILQSKERKAAEKQIVALNIKTPTMHQRVGSLSGGNQQKIVLGKWLIQNPDILILDEPTRGIDIGAKAEIYALINELAKEGKAIIMISSELPEIIGLSDRVLVLSGGRLTGEYSKEDITQEKIMTSATAFF
jgi:inositol transport system ATP-binding protein